MVHRPAQTLLFAAAAILALLIQFPAARAEQAPASQPAGGLPHLRVDRENKCVDLEATVVLRDGEWLELLACSPKSREHESILAVPARPSHIHLALLMLGLEPGSPMKWWREGDEPKSSPPRGPRIAVTLLYEKDGKAVEVPAGRWILNQKTKEVSKDSAWLFTGSQVSQIDGQSVYHADLNGTAISLVNFGDDLLSRDTTMTDKDDDATWGANTDAIPPVGTKVVIRLKGEKKGE